MKQQILALIKSNPNIRTVEISDKLDIDSDRIQPMIAAELGSGAVVVEPIRAPNGCIVHSFRYASAAPATGVAAASAGPVPARVVRAMPPAMRKAIAPVAAPAPAAQPGPMAAALEIDVPVTRKTGVPLIAVAPDPAKAPRKEGPSRVELAVKFLHDSGKPVSGLAMRDAMGLTKGQSPVNFLTGAVRGKRVAWDAEKKEWSLGVAELEKPVAVEPPKPFVLPTFVPGQGIIVDDARAELPKAQVAPAPASALPISMPAWTISASGHDMGIGMASPTHGSVAIGNAFMVNAGERFSHPTGPLTVRIAPREETFVAGLMSNGDLRIEQNGFNTVLPERHARALWDYMRKVAYSQWPTAAAL